MKKMEEKKLDRLVSLNLNLRETLFCPFEPQNVNGVLH